MLHSLLGVLFPPYLFAQENKSEATITVIVTDAESGTPLIGAVCYLVEGRSKLVVGFSSTDENGTCELNLKDSISMDLFLTINYLGYCDTTLTINPLKEDNQLNAPLKPCVSELPIAEVIGSSLPIVYKEDTTIVTVSAFRNRSDQYLGDLIRKVPGVEVTKDGQILKDGKSIDYLRINNRDILGNQHGFATSGISSDMVDRIEFVDNYSERWGEGELSEKKLMNIVLKEEAVERPKGDIAVGSGVPLVSYENKANLIYINKKTGGTGFLRANNINEKVISQFDYINILPDIFESLKSSRGDISKILPLALIDNEEYEDNNDGLIATNHLAELSGKTVKTTIIGGHLAKKYNKQSTWVFPDVEDIFNGNQKSTIRSKIFIVNSTIDIQLKKGMAKWSVEAKSEKDNQESLRDFGEALPSITTDNDRRRNYASTGFFLNHEISKFIELQAKGRLSFRKENYVLSNINSSTSFFKNDNTQNAAESILALAYRRDGLGIKGQWRSSNNFEKLFSSGNLFCPENCQDGENKKLFSAVNEPGIIFSFINKKIQFQLENIFSIITSNYSLETTEARSMKYSPSASMRWKLSRFRSISFNASRKQFPFDLLALNNDGAITSQDIFVIGNINANNFTDRYTTSLFFSNHNPLTGTRIVLQLAAHQAENISARENVGLSQGYLKQKISIIPNQSGLNGRLLFIQPLNEAKTLSATARLSFDKTATNIIRQGNNLPLSTSRYQWKGTLKFRPSDVWDGSVYLSHDINHQIIDGMNFENRTNRTVFGSQLNYSVGIFDLRTDLEFRYLKNDLFKQFYPDLNLSISVKTSNTWRFSIASQDLFHLRGSLQKAVIYSENILQTLTFNRSTGNMLIVAKRTF